MADEPDDFNSDDPSVTAVSVTPPYHLFRFAIRFDFPFVSPPCPHSSASISPELIATFGIIFALLSFCIHLVLASDVWRDAAHLNRHNGPGTFLAGENMRALIVLGFGLLGFATYWVMHHSTLRPPIPKDDAHGTK